MRSALERINMAVHASRCLRRLSHVSILLLWSLSTLSLSGCDQNGNDHVSETDRSTAMTVESKGVVLSQQYACRIHWEHQFKIRAAKKGYLEVADIKAGQQVKGGDLLFTMKPALSDAELAEAKLAVLEYNYLKQLRDDKVVVSCDGMAAQFEEAKAKAERAAADLDFNFVRAPFDATVDAFTEQQGSLIAPQDVLATLSDKSTLWVEFNVPNERFLEYTAAGEQKRDGLKIELILDDGSTFDQPGKFVVIDFKFDKTAAVIPVRAEFANPNRLRCRSESGTVVISRVKDPTIVIP